MSFNLFSQSPQPVNSSAEMKLNLEKLSILALKVYPKNMPEMNGLIKQSLDFAIMHKTTSVKDEGDSGNI